VGRRRRARRPVAKASLTTWHDQRVPPNTTTAVGIDLAWGPHGRTGLAAVTVDGTLTAMDTVATDAEIEQWLSAHTSGACIVAFDAPLVVRNASGMRDCERQVSRRFGSRQASCYPSNRANRNFADGGRAWNLATRLDLDTALKPAGDRRAIEVYPHAAIVSLFNLPTVLRYKKGRGRTVADRQSELLALLDHVESLSDATPPLRVAASAQWRSSRGVVEDATRPMHLNAIEDAVDAVVCSYVALLMLGDPARVESFGTEEDGAIMVPLPPAD
jgi:predicted RNase H-like nuclease